MENLRTRYTEQVIENALMTLLDEKPVEKITVRELCSIAGINRSTFYLHYQDVYDLIDRMYQSTIDEIIPDLIVLEPHTDSASRNLKIRNLLKAVYEKATWYRAVFEGKTGKDFLSDLYRRGIEELSSSGDRGLLADRKRVEYNLDFFIAGVVQVMRRWLRGDCSDPLEYIAELIEECFYANRVYL